MNINIPINPKLRNAIAEASALAGIAVLALPDLASSLHVPQWTGGVLALVVNVCNQLYKDSTPPPALAAAAAKADSDTGI